MGGAVAVFHREMDGPAVLIRYANAPCSTLKLSKREKLVNK